MAWLVYHGSHNIEAQSKEFKILFENLDERGRKSFDFEEHKYMGKLINFSYFLKEYVFSR